MFSDIIVIDNFLPNPDYYYEDSLKQQYFSSEENPTKSAGVYYSGKRTLFLDDQFGKPIINKLVKENIRQEADVSVECNFKCVYHFLDDSVKFDEKNIHKDTTLYAGLIYINKNITTERESNGTSVWFKDRNIVVPYLYNRLVFYRSDLFHGPLNGFGSDISNSRSTITFFLNNIDISIKNKLVAQI